LVAALLWGWRQAKDPNSDRDSDPKNTVVASKSTKFARVFNTKSQMTPTTMTLTSWKKEKQNNNKSTQ